MRQAAQGRIEPQDQVPPCPGLVLFDETKRPIYFNQEAMHVLAYPLRVKNADELAAVLPAQIGAWLDESKSGPQSLNFHSDGKHYVFRLLRVAHHSRKPSRGVKALLIERAMPRTVDISETAERFRLTPREQQTARFLMEGLTSKEIASKMKISPNTVKTFVRIIMMKMEVPTRSGIVGKLAGA